jgi:hypothetical protein
LRYCQPPAIDSRLTHQLHYDDSPPLQGLSLSTLNLRYSTVLVSVTTTSIAMIEVLCPRTPLHTNSSCGRSSWEWERLFYYLHAFTPIIELTTRIGCPRPTVAAYYVWSSPDRSGSLVKRTTKDITTSHSCQPSRNVRDSPGFNSALPDERLPVPEVQVN